MLRKWMLLTAIAATVATGPAIAGGHGNSHYVHAKVVNVEPIRRYVTVSRPRQECWDEVVHVTERRSTAGPAIAGGLIGGAIGRQFGGGSGRDALTIAGAIAGSAIAAERAARNRGTTRSHATTVEHCRVVDTPTTRERIDGYRVTYKYRGRHHTIVTQEPPGSRIRLHVSAIPVGYR